MDKTKRKAVIAGNWKMNMNSEETERFLSELLPELKGKNGCDIIICVPFTDIHAAVKAVKGTNVAVGAQNVHFAKSGAYTGEVSADMLLCAGVEYVIIGHSERRQYFGETDATVNQRVKAALEAGLKVILCVGETLVQREQGITAELVAMQTRIALLDVSAEAMKNVILAYEPVWAIGTGKTATSDQAEEVCAIIRDTLEQMYGKETAEAVTIQYGGSMKPGNAAELLSKKNVDGGLIGGASLKVDDFRAIIDAAQ